VGGGGVKERTDEGDNGYDLQGCDLVNRDHTWGATLPPFSNRRETTPFYPTQSNSQIFPIFSSLVVCSQN